MLLAGAGELVSQPPFAGAYIVQEFVPNDGHVHKVYVAGQEVRGLIKRSTAAEAVFQPALPIVLAAELVELALGAGAALGLDIFGVDFLFVPEPVIVDVNPFPGFRGVPDAVQSIVAHLSFLATGRTDTAGQR